MRFEPIPWPNAEVWPFVAGLLERSVSRTDDDTLLDIVDELNGGSAQLWVAFDQGIRAAVVTRLTGAKDGLALEIWHLGGSGVRSWMRLMLDAVEQFGRTMGCIKVTTGCRMGWKRLARDYSAVAVKLEKRL